MKLLLITTIASLVKESTQAQMSCAHCNLNSYSCTDAKFETTGCCSANLYGEELTNCIN